VSIGDGLADMGKGNVPGQEFLDLMDWIVCNIFQLSIVALVPTILLFLVTADWTQPLRSMRPMAFPAAALVVAFAALYYLEHYC